MVVALLRGAEALGCGDTGGWHLEPALRVGSCAVSYAVSLVVLRELGVGVGTGV